MLPYNMIRPSPHFAPTSVFSYARNSFQITTSHTLKFRQSATSTFQTTSPLFTRHPGVYPQKANPKRNPLQPGAEIRAAEPAFSPKNRHRPEHAPLHRNHSATVAPHPLSMYIEPRSHLHHSARRLGPRFGSALSYERSEITSGIRTLQL